MLQMSYDGQGEMVCRTQSDSKKKGPSFFTFSSNDQAVGHTGFDKLLRWAEIDFPQNPVYAEPKHLPQLNLPNEEKFVMARHPMSAPSSSCIRELPARPRTVHPARKSLERQWIALAQQHIRPEVSQP